MRRYWIFCCAAGLGCNDPTYLTEYRSLQTGDAVDGGGLATDTDTFTIPIRKPSGVERTDLNNEQKAKALPMPVPWVGVRDLPVQIDYTVQNLDAAPSKVFFGLLGGSEFAAYDPGAYINPLDPNAVAPPPLAGGTPIDLAPNGSAQLTFREDDLAEAGVDLEAITRYPGAADPSIPFKVLNTRSDVSQNGLDKLPPMDVIPQLVHLTFQLSASTHVRVDYVIRVRNLTDRLAPAGLLDLYP